MFCSLFISSYFDINTQIQYIVICALIFSFFSATQDIALDALVYKTLTKEQRTLGNAIKVSGGLIGTILGGGVALMIYSYIGWQNTLFILAVVTSISILQLLFFKETTQEKVIKKKVAVFKEFYSFWQTKNRKIWFIFIFLFPSAIASAHGLIAPILVDEKWELQDIGFIVHIVGYSIGILASFGTSFLVNKFGRINILILSAFGQIFSILLLLIILNGYNNIYIVTVIVGLIYLFYTPTATIISILMMDEIDSENPASQYAIQHSIFMFSIIVFASLSVYFSGKLGYENII